MSTMCGISTINHRLCIYSIPLIFARIIYALHLLSSIGLGIGCSVQSMKERKTGKYFSTSSGVFNLFIL